MLNIPVKVYLVIYNSIMLVKKITKSLKCKLRRYLKKCLHIYLKEKLVVYT